MEKFWSKKLTSLFHCLHLKHLTLKWLLVSPVRGRWFKKDLRAIPIPHILKSYRYILRLCLTKDLIEKALRQMPSLSLVPPVHYNQWKYIKRCWCLIQNHKDCWLGMTSMIASGGQYMERQNVGIIIKIIVGFGCWSFSSYAFVVKLFA